MLTSRLRGERIQFAHLVFFSDKKVQLSIKFLKKHKNRIVFWGLFLTVFVNIVCFQKNTIATVLEPEEQFLSPVILNSLERTVEIKMQEARQNNLNKYQGKIIEKINPKTSDKIIALTFDDGPDGKTTLQVLDILERYEVKGTFFLIGENVKKYPYVTRRIVELGHAIGNHTLTHAYRSMSPESAQREIEETANEIAPFTPNRPLLFRPPLGRMNNGLVEYAKEHDYLTVLWSINSEDSVGYPGVKTIAANVINRAHSGGIVLLHDAPWYRWKTIAALPIIIERLKGQGYRFVTVPELLTLAKETPR